MQTLYAMFEARPQDTSMTAVLNGKIISVCFIVSLLLLQETSLGCVRFVGMKIRDIFFAPYVA